MERLPDIVKQNKFGPYHYELIKRTEYVAMYAQIFTDPDTGNQRVHSYEVFRIKRQKAGESVIKGRRVVFVAKELFPYDNDFGETAFSIPNVNQAERRFDQLNRQVAQKNKPNGTKRNNGVVRRTAKL